MRRNQRQGFTPAFVVMAAALGLATLYGTPRSVGAAFRGMVSSKRPRRNWVKPHDGEEERERRRRQIAKGQITKSNGLVV